MSPRKRKVLLFLAVLAALISGSIMYRYFREGIKVDECLDVKHGSFDYSTMSCDLTRHHAYIPYKLRHPYDETIVLTAAFGLIVFGLAFLFTRNPRTAN
jgi:hypothetical protein